MTKTIHLFMWVCVLVGLTSCSQKAPEMQPIVTPPPVLRKPPPPLPPSPPSPRKVGVLLPLSGPHAELGKGLLDAAELALFEGKSPVVLLPQDTAQDPLAAAQKALHEGAELLVGPIFASEVEKIKPLLNRQKINLICFSTDQAVAGNSAYVLGLLPSQQIERVLEFAKDKGLIKIAALTPEDQYGKLVDQALERLGSNGTIQLLGITHYTKGDILEGNPGNARLLEEVEAYKIKGLQALLIPEGGENLTYLMTLLGPQGSVKILGSGQWDTPETVLVPGLEGGVFASTSPQGRRNFEQRFQGVHGYVPARIASLSYDAIALAMALADKGYTPETLTMAQGFAGTEGLFRLTPQGLNERGLAIFEVSPAGFRPLSPAPEAF